MHVVNCQYRTVTMSTYVVDDIGEGGICELAPDGTGIRDADLGFNRNHHAVEAIDLLVGVIKGLQEDHVADNRQVVAGSLVDDDGKLAFEAGGKVVLSR